MSPFAKRGRNSGTVPRPASYCTEIKATPAGVGTTIWIRRHGTVAIVGAATPREGNARMGLDQWPLVLAGPMVRRVEPGLVAVWVALKESRAVRLTVFQGTTDTGSGDGVFTGGTAVATGDSVTMRVGDNVHVA